MNAIDTINIARLRLEAMAREDRLSFYALAALAVFSSLYTASALYSIYLHPLRRVPGPFMAKFTELWRTAKYARGNWHHDILQLHSKYGPVVRVAPNEVSIVDKQGLAQVFGHSKGTKKTNWYNVWSQPNLDESFFSSTEPAKHSFLRKRVSAAYSMSGILSLEPEVEEVANKFWEKLDEKARNHETINMHDWASYFAFDVVGKLALGSPIGFVREEKDVMHIISSIHTGFYQAASMGYIVGQMTWFTNPVVSYIQSLSAHSASSFFVWSFNQLKKRQSMPKDPNRKKDLLDHFMGMKEPDGSLASDPSILSEIGNIIGAGADTTSIGMRSVLIQLLMHPEDYARVQDEVDDAYRTSSAAGGPGGRGISYLAIEKLTYLNACIKEALRLHPSILWQLPREAPAKGIEIAGYYIAPSATISMSPIAQGRDRAVFGANADLWHPARWIPSRWNTEQQIREMDRYSVTFGYGARTCTGRHLALLEINKFIAGFVHRYNATFANRDRPFVTKSQWFSYQADMFLNLELRDIVAGEKESS